MRGIILSAGLGKRLGKITRGIPKPLLPVGGVPIIKLIIKKLKRAGIDKIGINLYYKADIIKERLKGIKGLRIVKEKYLSDTGGALLNFKNFVSADFLIHNCDIISDVDLKRIIRVHKKIRPGATIVLVKNFKTDRVRILNNRIIKFYKKRMENCYTYSGIAVLSKRIFNYFPKSKKIFALTEVYNNAIKDGELLYPVVVNNTWCDIGTLENYRKWKDQKLS
uniref:NDP-sugar synthase n=1 Tax=candidate division WOR-3 bacterium TaxID=2052148 RepID=A0A7C4XKG5_UNCW3